MQWAKEKGYKESKILLLRGMPSMSMMSLVLFFCEAGIRVILGNLWMMS
jgi:hypothetical protein